MVLDVVAISTDKKLAQECAGKDGEEVTNIHGHDGNHAAGC